MASSMGSPRRPQRLRYDAYEAPNASASQLSPPRLRRPSRALSTSAKSDRSWRSHGERDEEDTVAQSLSPGRLALAVGDDDLKSISKVGVSLARVDLVQADMPHT